MKNWKIGFGYAKISEVGLGYMDTQHTKLQGHVGVLKVVKEFRIN